MMSLEENSIGIDIGTVHNCKVCGGKGQIQIFRNDLEEFEEIECDNCK